MASDVSGVNLAEASKLAVASSSGVDLHDHPSTGIFFVSETVLRYEVKSPEELLQLVARGKTEPLIRLLEVILSIRMSTVYFHYYRCYIHRLLFRNMYGIVIAILVPQLSYYFIYDHCYYYFNLPLSLRLPITMLPLLITTVITSIITLAVSAVSFTRRFIHFLNLSFS